MFDFWDDPIFKKFDVMSRCKYASCLPVDTIICICILLVLYAYPLAAMADEHTDSTALMLDEILIEGKHTRIENGKIVCVPTAQEKKLTNSAASLLAELNLPALRRKDEQISNNLSNKVVAFINGREADEIDLKTFWPKHVSRVEYIQNSDNPKYKGYPAVVDFSMPIFLVGGIAKALVLQSIPVNGVYDITSKVAYGCMNFGVRIGGDYRNLPEYFSQTNVEYRNVWLDNCLYDRIDVIQADQSQRSKSKGFNVVALASFLNKRNTVRLDHILSFKSGSSPMSGMESEERWTPDIFSSSSAYDGRRQNSRSFQIDGKYGFELRKNSLLFVNWYYSHSSSGLYNYYRLGDMNPIENDVTSHSNSVGIDLKSGWNWNRRFGLEAKASTVLDCFSTRYEGNSVDATRQYVSESSIDIGASWTINPKWFVMIRPALFINCLHSGGGISNTYVLPKFAALAEWYASNAFTSTASFNFSASGQRPSTTDDVMIRQSELLWLKGNPDLKPARTLKGQLSGTWMPADMINGNLTIDYTRYYNAAYLKVTSAEKSIGGVITGYENSRPMDNVSISASINGNLFRRKLTISVAPSFSYQRACTYRVLELSRFNFRGNIAYRLGNCRFSVEYESPRKDIFYTGISVTSDKDNWNFRFSYSNGNLYVSLAAMDIFHKYSCHSVVENQPGYSMNFLEHSIGRRLMLTLSYTFSFGKLKPMGGSDIQVESKSKSGVLTKE